MGLIFLALLVAGNALLAVNAHQWRFDRIVVHHSATSSGDYASIKAMHAKREWDDAAYQLILSNGSSDLPAGFLEASGRYGTLTPGPATLDQTANLRGLHLCIIGNYQQNPLPDGMKTALAHALRLLCERYDVALDRIQFHRDVSPTVCPGKYIGKEELLGWVRDLANSCPEEIAEQHKSVLETARLTLATYPWSILGLHALVSGAIVSAWILAARFRRSRRPANRHSSRIPRSSHRSARNAARSSEIRFPRPK